MADIKTYFISIARLAFGWWGIGRNVSVLLLSIVVLFIGATAGLELTFTDYAGQLWLRMLAIAFLFLLFVVAPYRLWLAQRHELAAKDASINEMQFHAATKAASHEKLEELWRYREAGIILRNERLRTKEDFHPWLRRVEEWRIHALTAAGEVSVNLRSRLTFLDQTRPLPDGINPTSAEHAHHLRILSEIVARIGEYQEKHT